MLLSHSSQSYIGFSYWLLMWDRGGVFSPYGGDKIIEHTFNLGAWNTFICRSCPFKPPLPLVETTNILRKWFNFSLSVLGKVVLFFPQEQGVRTVRPPPCVQCSAKQGGIECFHELKESLWKQRERNS